jgi:hypothetical protein
MHVLLLKIFLKIQNFAHFSEVTIIKCFLPVLIKTIKTNSLSYDWLVCFVEADYNFG